ncbi:hypothetical protein COCVIDRAFT_28489 [Bipolaris victoriae FI3]|uniref:WSC domain-containing protein n=1 Tax=Bipolaris victoriae (strain FI3) TaxID=930091 RepID=W7EKL2_BIPV3|nr:hypothetical protein COCVIDRAFT_28489 [Bipolaris victoriae FI3]
MRASWTLAVSALYTTTISANDMQYAMGGLDLPGTMYACASPSITCTDPSLNNHDCSCTCTNGLTFKQPVPSPIGDNATACPSLDECQASNVQCLEREQALEVQLVSKQQQLVNREKTLSAQLAAKQAELNNNKPFMFLPMTCRVETNNGISNSGTAYRRLPKNSPRECAQLCSKSGFFFLGDGTGCSCGNTSLGTVAVPVAECSTKCPGDPNQTCGSPIRVMVYFKYYI